MNTEVLDETDRLCLSLLASTRAIECPQRNELAFETWCLCVRIGIKKRIMQAAAAAENPHAFLDAILASLSPSEVVALNTLAIY